MDRQESTGSNITSYVSVSVERGQVKTSCSTHLSCEIGRDRGEMEDTLAESMAAAMAVAAMATKSVVDILSSPLPPGAVETFVGRVNRLATDIANGGR
jgi:hypothetical protein